MVTEWHGDNPYYLLCVDKHSFGPDGQPYQRIDLDERQWATIHEEWMRRPGEWHLIRKEDDGVAFSMVIHEGEQPYYTSRVFGATGIARLARAYGIGKKHNDGTMMRLWILENGQVCGGDDVDVFGRAALED